jgi:hypothetical protein
MAITNIPDEDHVLRLVSWQRVRKDEDDNVTGILGEAFRRKPDEDALSVNWQERVTGALIDQLRAAARLIRDTQESKKIGAKSRLARLQVKATKEIAKKRGAKIRIVHEPVDGNEPHAAIRQLPDDDLELLEMIASEVVVDHHQCGPLLQP